jgi:hypothetical protein
MGFDRPTYITQAGNKMKVKYQTVNKKIKKEN